jgi:hypothetical protein
MKSSKTTTIILLVITLASLTTTMAVVTTMTTQTAFAQTDNCRPDGSDRTCSGGTGQPSIGSGNRNPMTIDDTGLITSTTLTGGDGGGRSTNEEGNTVLNGGGDGGGRSTNEEGNTVLNGGGDGGGRSTCDAFPTGCDFDGRNAIHERGAGDNS